METTRYETAVGQSIGFRSLDQVIDKNTGLVAKSRDTAGLETTFEYDKMGRLLWSRPTSGAWTQYFYAIASSGVPARVLITRHPNGNANVDLVEEEIHFDDFGRVAKMREKMPDGTWSSRDTLYDEAGNTSDVSEAYTTATTNNWTEYRGFDPFGRPKTVKAPDGSVIDFTYFGIRTVNRKVKVATGGTAAAPTLTDAITREDYDMHGRLYKVQEPGGATATHTYDVGQRLTQVQLSGSADQTRMFVYDNRGFLTAECHPEIGGTPSGGCRRYSGFDAKGHATEVDTDDLPMSIELRMKYDKAERLTEIREDAGPVLKAYTYWASNVGANLGRGKLRQARRFNRLDVPWDQSQTQSVVVEEDYVYAGVGGQVSSRTTNVPTLGEVFIQTWTYDDLGNVTSMGYPNCTHSPCSGSVPTRTVSQTFTQGRLTSIPGFAIALEYHPGGMVKRVAHANNMDENIGVAGNGMQRPHTISVTYPGGGGSLGEHRYDGAGNLRARENGGATETYWYDTVGRLRRFTTGGGTHEEYFYDSFGNLRQVNQFDGSTTTPIVFAIDSKRNRLSTGFYDREGNLTQWGTESYRYDALDVVRHRDFPSESYIYTANDERLATLRYSNGTTFSTESWTLRDLNGKVLRRWEHDLTPPGTGLFADDFESGTTAAWDQTVGLLVPPQVDGVPLRSFGTNQGVWTWVKDYVYRDGTMLAAVSNQQGNQGTIHFAVDHLGTPRLMTNAVGGFDGIDFYWGFGNQFSDEPSDENQRFTGHERDNHRDENTSDDLDYMHARYYSTHLKRFLSVDPSRASATPKVPQSWNRYSYALNSPLKYVDPDGRVVETAWDVANVSIGAASLVANVLAGNFPGAILDAGGLAVDLGATVVPGVPGGAGTLIKGGRAARAARLAVNARRGRLFEGAVLDAVQFSKNTKRTTALSGKADFRIPDGLDKGILLEIKSGKMLSLNAQARDFIASAAKEGHRVVFAVTNKTKISSRFKKLVENGDVVIVRFTPE